MKTSDNCVVGGCEANFARQPYYYCGVVQDEDGRPCSNRVCERHSIGLHYTCMACPGCVEKVRDVLLSVQTGEGAASPRLLQQLLGFGLLKAAYALTETGVRRLEG